RSREGNHSFRGLIIDEGARSSGIRCSLEGKRGVEEQDQSIMTIPAQRGDSENLCRLIVALQQSYRNRGLKDVEVL
ncbi:hypothetical protein X777_08481, partial [Ooceraea biroi]